MRSFVGVPRTSAVQQRKLLVGQVDQLPANPQGKFSRTRSMVRIASFILPLRIVQYGKQADNVQVGPGFLSQAAAILQDARPMRHAVIAVQGESVFGEDCPD
jgi:hypothetical protein